MVSDYLLKVVRDRLTIARDLSLSAGRCWETIAVICDSFDVMFACSTVNNGATRPKLTFVSRYSWQLTGYWPRELVGVDPNILRSPKTNITELRRFNQGLTADGFARTKIAIQRKNRDVSGCEILAHADDMNNTNEARYLAYLAKCPYSECN